VLIVKTDMANNPVKPTMKKN
ncbi:MAG: universal stress protein, partial [Lactobacillus sp.]|nr:universal stress protein [Lactobacillus sp.]